MEITLLGTGSPISTVERGGTSIHLTIDGESILVDCGPFTMHRMVTHDVDPSAIETLFITHHHIDHNADFFGFVIGSWGLGREELTIYGPEGIEDYVEAMYDLWADDIEYREWFGYDAAGIRDIDIERTTADLSVAGNGWTADALPVEHSIETYGYRFEESSTGTTCVISSDTKRIDSLVDFASGADVLIQDCSIGPVADDPPTEGLFLERLTEPMPDSSREKHKQNHCDPEDAAWVAQEAGVDTVVLTHLVPYRDYDAMRERVAAGFDGEVIVGEDGKRLVR